MAKKKDYKDKKGATGKQYTTYGDRIKVTYTDGSTRVVRPTDASYGATKKAMESDIVGRNPLGIGNKKSKTTAVNAIGNGVKNGQGLVSSAAVEKKAKQATQKRLTQQVMNSNNDIRPQLKKAGSAGASSLEQARMVNGAVAAALPKALPKTFSGNAIKSGAEQGVLNLKQGTKQGLLALMDSVAPMAEPAGKNSRYLTISPNAPGQKKRDAQLEQKRRNLARETVQKQQAIANKYGPLNMGEQIVHDVIANAIPMVPSMAGGALGGGAAAAAGLTAKGTKLAQTVGAMAPMFNYARGMGEGQALNEGATMDESNRYGLARAIVETGSEMMFAGYGKLMPGMLRPSQFTSKIASPVLKKSADMTLRALGEGTEEVVAEAADPYLQRAIYNPDAQNATLGQLGYAGLLGALTSGIINAGAAGVNMLPRASANAANSLRNPQGDHAADTALHGAPMSERIAQQERLRAANTPVGAETAPQTEQITAQNTQNAQNQAGMEIIQDAINNTIQSNPGQQTANHAADNLEQPVQNGNDVQNRDRTANLQQEAMRSNEESVQEPEQLIDWKNVQLTDLSTINRDVLEFYDKATKNSKLDIAIVDGLPDTVNGCFHNGRIYMNSKKATDAETVRMIFSHELFHGMTKTEGYDSMINTALDWYKSIYRGEGLEVTREDLIEMVRQDYAATTNGQIQLSDDDAVAELGAQFMERAITDDAFIDKLVSEQPHIAQRIWQALKEWLSGFGKRKGDTATALELEQMALVKRAQKLYEKSFRQLQRTGMERSDDVNYSIGYTTTQEPVVVIKDNIFNNMKPGQKKHKYISDYIKQHIGEMYTIIESGQKVYIGKDLPGEFTQSKYTQGIDSRDRYAKNQSIQNVGELIEIATNKRWEKAKHKKHSTDAKYGFYKYTTRFALPNGEVYTADLVIRNDANGKKYLYDMIGIKKDSSTLASTQNGSASRVNNSTVMAATTFHGSTISQNGRNVNTNSNTQHSLGENGDRAARQKALLEKIQAERAQAKAKGKELSKAYTNTIMNSKLFTEAEKQIELSSEGAEHDKVSEKESLRRAAERLGNDYEGTVADLENRQGWKGEDLDAAVFILQRRAEAAQESGDYGDVRSWLKGTYERATEGGRFIQAFAKYSRNTDVGIMLQAQRNVAKAEEQYKSNKILGVEKDSKKWRRIQNETKQAQKAIQDAEAGAEKTAKDILFSHIDRLGDSLRNRILDGVDPELRAKGKVADSRIVSELYTILKEAGLPDYSSATRRQHSQLDYLKDAIEHKTEYAMVFQRAQEFMKQKYGNDPETLAIIEDALNGNFQDLELYDFYSQRTLQNAVKETAKLADIDLKQIIKENKGNKDAAAQVITKHIIDYTNVSEQEAQELSNAVVKAYYSELNRLTQQRLKQLFPETVRPQLKRAGQKSAFDKLMELINLGAYENQEIVDIIKEKNKLPVLTNEDIANIQKYVAQANEYQIYSREWKIAMAKAHKIASDKMPVSIQEKATHLKRLAMLSNPATHGRNVEGNVPLAGTEMISNSLIAAPIDMAVSKIRGTQRTISANPHLITQMKGFGKGLAETVSDIKHGVNTYRMGDTTTTQYEMPHGRTFQNQNGGIMGTVNDFLNTVDMMVSYGLMAGDRPFFEAHYNKRMKELEGLGYDMNAEETKADAYAYAIDLVFQNESNMSKAATLIRDGLNHFRLGPFRLGDFVIPFAQTPANIADKILDYSPVGIAKAAAELGGAVSGKRPFNQKLFSQRLARGVTGSGIMAIGYALAAAGCATGGYPDDQDERQALIASGWQPYSFYINGKYYKYQWAQPVAALIAIGADVYNNGLDTEALNDLWDDITEGNLDQAGEDIGAATAALGTAFKSGANCFLTQSFFANLSDFFGGYGDTLTNMANTAMSFPTQYVPAILYSANKTIDPYQRETYDPNPLKQTTNKVVARLPFASQTLPEKLNIYGEEMPQNQGRGAMQRTVENMLLPATITEDVSMPLNDELLRLKSATGDGSAFFAMPNKKADFGDGQKIQMTTQERQEFIKNGNGYAAKQAEKLIQTSYYKSLPDDEKIKAVKGIKEIANYKAMKQLAKDHDIAYSKDEMENKLELLKECGNDYSKYFKVSTAFSGDKTGKKVEKMESCDRMHMKYETYENITNSLDKLHDSTDSRGKTVKGKSKQDKVYAYLTKQYQSGNITKEQCWYLWVDSYSPERNDGKYPYWKNCPYKWIVQKKQAEKAEEKEEKKNRA